MLDRQTTMLDAAFTVFTRYGYRRATMNDIAKEAGVARQTLYNAFSNKETLLRALIQAHVDETCAALSDHISNALPLEEGLELAFDHFARKPFELLRNTAHGDEIMEALENSASEEMVQSKERFTQGMIALLAPHVRNNGDDSPDAAQLADFIVHTSMGHKAKASSAEHLERLLATLKKLVIASIQTHQGFA